MRYRSLLPLVGAAILAIAGCGENGGDAAEVYRHSLDEAPSTLDPAHAATTYASFVVVNAYDTLYSYKYLKRPYELKPNLAAAMPEIGEDGLTYTIPIREGVHFIDDPAFENGEGREVTAQDVVYSLKRHFDPATRSRGRWLWQDRIEGLDQWHDDGADYGEPVPGLEAVDRYTLRVTLTEPYPQFVHTLAMGFSAVVPREAVEHYGEGFAVNPVGSGPFRVTEFNSTHVTLVPNEDWRWQPVNLDETGFDPKLHGDLGLETIDGRTPPFVDRIRIDFVEEHGARWSSFTKGDEIQFTVVPNEQAAELLERRRPVRLKERYAERFHSRSYLEAGFVFTGFNLDQSSIGYHPDPAREERNHALRCAMRKAFDWQARNNRFYFGLGRVFPGVIPPMVPQYDASISRESVTRDVEGAKRLLEEHGWNADNLPVLEYGYPASVKERQAFEQFRGFVEEIGYPRDKIRGRPYATFGDYSRALKQSEVAIFYMNWYLDYPDAQNTLQLFYGPHGSPGSNNMNYSNPAFDRLYERASTMKQGERRTELYHRMNRMVMDDCAVISGVSRTRVMLWHRDVVVFPDHQMVGGFFLPYVDTRPGGGASGS